MAALGAQRGPVEMIHFRGHNGQERMDGRSGDGVHGVFRLGGGLGVFLFNAFVDASKLLFGSSAPVYQM